MELEQIGEVRKVGNGGGVLVPKKWLGKQVKVILIDRTDELRKEVFEMLGPYLYDIQGVYLVGSYARGEQEKGSDIDILAVSNSLRKNISSGKYHIEIYPLDRIKNSLINSPIIFSPRFLEAKTLLNELLLNEIKKIQSAKGAFKIFFEECRRVIKINKEFIDLDKAEGSILESVEAVAYSTILRLRGVFMVKCISENRPYSSLGFKKWVLNGTKLKNEEFEEMHGAYLDVKNDVKPSQKIKISSAEEILAFLEKEVEKYGKKKKKA